MRSLEAKSSLLFFLKPDISLPNEELLVAMKVPKEIEMLAINTPVDTFLKYCLFFKNARAMAKIGISTTSDRETRSQIAMFAPESRSGIK
jgi:hypothetical protein